MKNYNEIFLSSVYAFGSEKNILEEKDIGIVSNVSSILTPWRSVSAMNCHQGCPYTNTAFDFDVRIDGERGKAVVLVNPNSRGVQSQFTVNVELFYLEIPAESINTVIFE